MNYFKDTCPKCTFDLILLGIVVITLVIRMVIKMIKSYRTNEA